MKICPHCKKKKNLEGFSFNRSAKSGYNSWCKLCEKEYRTGLGREKIREYKHARREKLNTQRQERTQRARLLAIQTLGGQCAKCGYKDERALQVDHVYGGGNKDQMLGNRAAFYKKVAGDGEHYQLLCANCNWIKRYEKAEVSRFERCCYQKGILSCL